MKILNPILYSALGELFKQEVKVTSIGIPAMVSCPPLARTRLKKASKRYAVVEDWGEVYSVNCPKCTDTKHRLFFSHMYNQAVMLQNTKYNCGRVYICHNEHCTLWPSPLKDLVVPESMMDVKVSAFIGFYAPQPEVDLPDGCIPLLSDALPTEVIDYIHGRQFDLTELANTYMVHYAPIGTQVMVGPTLTKLYEPRLVIPITSGRRLIGYQCRRIEDIPKDKHKYLNSDIRKSACLYNADTAMYFPDVVLVEGVSDVWRIGVHSIGVFGKSLSAAQIELLKTIWGFDGKCLIVLDGEAYAEALKMEAVLRREKAFPQGIGVVQLPPEYDPGNYQRQEITKIIGDSWHLAHN